MTHKWPRMSLREARVSLIDCDHRTPRATDTGLPYVAIPQLKDGRLNLAAARRISHVDFLSWTRKAKPTENDVILSRRCNPGETAFVPPNLEIALGQNLVLLRADGTKVYPPFLRWLVRSPEWWAQVEKFMNAGAVFDSLKCADVPNFELSIPPVPDQRTISDVLGSLDEKIELNHRMNETLEAVIRARFESKFIRCDAASKDGWSHGSLGDVVGSHRRVCAPAELKQGARYIGLEHMPRRSIALDTWGEASELESNKFEFQRGDILFGKLRPYFHKVGVAPVDGVCSTDIFVVRPRTPRWFGFALGHLSSDELVRYADGASAGTKMPRVNWQDLAKYEVVLPPESEAADYSQEIEPLVARIQANIHEARRLTSVRDALLPELLP